MTDQGLSGITVRYTLGFREHVAMVRAINAVLRRVRRLKAIAWLCAIAFLVTLPVASVSMSTSAFLLLIPLVILPIIYLAPVYGTYLSRRGNTQWDAEQSLTLDDRGIDASNGTATSFISWEAVIRIADTPRFLLLFTSPQVAYGMPKRAIPDGISAPAVLEYMRHRAGRQFTGALPDLTLITGSPTIVADCDWQTWEAFLAFWSISRLSFSLWVMAAAGLAIGAVGIGESIVFQHQQGRAATVGASLVIWSAMPLLLILLIHPVTALIYAIWLPRVNPSIGARRIVIADDGIQVRGRITAADVRWSTLTRVVETRRFFLLFLSKIQAIYIPKRVLQPADTEVLRTLLRRHINGRILTLREERPGPTRGESDTQS
jgi:hypothetical protein